MNNMTAVEWLVDKLKSQGLLIGEIDNLVAVRKAKEMEKEQQGYNEKDVIEILLTFRAENPRYIEEFLQQFKKK